MSVTTTSPRRFGLLALIALALYAMLPLVAVGISQAEPSFAGNLFWWVTRYTKHALEVLHDSGTHLSAAAGFAVLCALLFGIYALALRWARDNHDARTQKLVFLGGAAFLLVQVMGPVMLSSDVFAYALYGRVTSVYHANPYDLAPPVAPNDPFLKLFGQEYLPSWYGPVWTLISTGITSVTGSHVGLTVLAFRLTAIVAALGCAALLWASLRRHAPERTTQGLVFFLWNPLVIIETGLSGHNDAIMLIFVLLGVWLHLRGWKTSAVVAFTLSALVKFLTGMLVPLYILLVLREAKTWRERGLFVLRSGVAAGLVGFAAVTLTKSNAGAPTSHAAIATDFYQNNFHELLLKGLRLGLGEDVDSVKSPIYFQGWWLAASTNTFLQAQPDDEAKVQTYLDPGARVVVIAPQNSDHWARVYDPVSEERGFVPAGDFTDSTRPAYADEKAKLFETMTSERPTVVKANNLLRAALWLTFAAFGLWCAWKTDSFEEFLVWSAAALLASCFLIITEIWPWYANWAVAVAALATTRRPAWLAAVLSACVLTLYITIGFQGSERDWIFTLRSLPAYMLPLVLFGLYWRYKSPKPGAK